MSFQSIFRKVTPAFLHNPYNIRAFYLRNLDQNGGLTMILDKIALILVIIGALNWGSIGLFGFDLVAFFCGGQLSILARIIFTLVGLAGLWCISLLFRGEEETGHAPHTA